MRSALLPHTVRALCVLCLLTADSVRLLAQAKWLDQPLRNWNAAGATMPRGTPTTDGAEPLARCKVQPPSTAGGRALTAAGWIPQAHLDRELTRNGVEILAGARSLDAACAPTAFNLFVFVDGAYAGTLSPDAMSPRADAAAGPVRLVGETISAEFARYKDGDARCCPTARMSVRYRIDRSGSGAVVVPLDVRTTRSY